ncbi:hypothetical protein DNTS_035683 [Danionella cerebrum]|uniref:Fanconi anemia core complex-associated protein 100 n=1 Tax=Danionella cerebrum TaxID=2873325 RepID=A0A553RFU6_9TELE|nr:hypothetical protein DNTS_035683 [Danionella translucida]
MVVEYLSEFSDSQAHPGRIILNRSQIFLCKGCRDVFIFNVQEKKSFIQFEASVVLMELSDDLHRLYVLCENSGLYCTPVPSHPRSSSDNPEPVLHTVSEDSLVLKSPSLQAFTISKKILVTLSRNRSVWSFDLYEETGSKPLGKLTHYQMPTVFTCLNQTDKEKSEDTTPVLTCIYPEGSKQVNTNQPVLHAHLELRLFRLLFGVDASLLNSPVILCGLPDGRIFFFPLLVPTMTGSRGEQRSPIRVLQNLEQPVVFIGTCVSGENGPQCLVALGQKGKLLTVKSKQSSLEKKEADYSFTEHSIQSPILCACVDDKRLYYSSFSELLALQLTAASSSDEEAESPQQVLMSNSLGVSRVTALAGPFSDTTGSIQLLALSSSGRLLRVNVPLESEKGSVSLLPLSLAGQRVKDLLASIGNVWERAQSMKHKLRAKNDSLKRLNQVIHVCSLLLESHANEKESHMAIKHSIRCHGVTRWSSLLQRDSLNLTCTLENSSACTLEYGWTLCIQIHPLFQLPNSSRTYSFPLRKLESGQNVDVTIPIENNDGGGLFLPVRVCCSLTFSLFHLFDAETSPGVSQILKETGSISAPLNSFIVDCLDALRMERSSFCGTVRDGVQSFLRSRGVLAEDADATSKSGLVSVVVKVSSELMKSRLNTPSSSNVGMCVSLLNWLISSDAVGLVSIQSPVVSAYSPDGCSVSIMAREVTLGDFYSEGPLEVLEIRVESSSLAAVCGLHHAILRRLEVLLRNSEGNGHHQKHVKAQSLREAVRHIESLYKDLQDAQNQAALGGTMKTCQISEILLQIFLQLRANPLVIL